MCMRARMCVRVHVEARGQIWVSTLFFLRFITIIINLIVLIVYVHLSALSVEARREQRSVSPGAEVGAGD